MTYSLRERGAILRRIPVRLDQDSHFAGGNVRAIAWSAAAAVCVVLAAASPAVAFPGFTLTTGGGVATTAQIPYAATATSNLTVNDITAPTSSWTCSSGSGSNASTLSGTVSRGTSSSNSVGTVTASKFGTGTWNGTTVVAGTNPCLAAGVKIAAQHGGTWAISVAGATTNGATPVKVTNIRMKVYIGTCSFDLAGATASTGGSVSGTYANGSSLASLTISSSAATTLIVYNTSVSGGCFANTIRNGDRFTLGGTYSVAVGQGSSALNPISLTS